jgi:hypothetical protein
VLDLGTVRVIGVGMNTSNARSAFKICPRCSNRGCEAYQHRDQGKCYVCGRLPEAMHEHTGGTSSVAQTPRERSIHQLLTMILCVQERVTNRARLSQWLEMSGADLESELAAAPADVATRARAALAKMGVTSWPTVSAERW